MASSWMGLAPKIGPYPIQICFQTRCTHYSRELGGILLTTTAIRMSEDLQFIMHLCASQFSKIQYPMELSKTQCPRQSSETQINAESTEKSSMSQDQQVVPISFALVYKNENEMLNGNSETMPLQPSMLLLEGVIGEGQVGQVEEPMETVDVSNATFDGLRIFVHAPRYEWHSKVHV